MDDGDWTELFEEHRAALVARLTMVLRDPVEAEDVAQEAYVRAYRARDRFDGANPRAWLYTIGHRLALNEIRRRKRWLLRQAALRSDRELTIPDHDLWEALKTVAPKQRAALLLHVVDGYSLHETARILGAPVATATSWVHRAKQKLKAVLKEDLR